MHVWFFVNIGTVVIVAAHSYVSHLPILISGLLSWHFGGIPVFESIENLDQYWTD